MPRVLVDANVVIDLVELGSPWSSWSQEQLRRLRPEGLSINQIIYAEISLGFQSRALLDEVLDSQFARLNIPWEAALPAGKAFLAYRQRGGTRTSPLPDFYIGAHAQVAGLTLVTRDATRYRTYFPDLSIFAPD
jgi:predicted nucleic acid-binding protein